MKLTLDGDILMLHVRHLPMTNPYLPHTHETTVTAHFGACPDPERRKALGVCPVVLPDTPVAAGRGTARCSKRDQFVKATGLKLALARALKDLGASADERRLLWRAFFEATGDTYIAAKIAA